jgi:predicted nucleic acid binding AN1-type Zn finger protein
MCPILDCYGVAGIFNSRTRSRVIRVLRDQLAGDALNLVAYSLRCKHYFCT